MNQVADFYLFAFASLP